MGRGFSAALILAFLVSGCSMPPAPPAVPSQDDLLNKPNACWGGRTVPVGNQVSLGVMYSENTRVNRAYLRQYQASAGTGFGYGLLVHAIRDAYIASSNPDLMVDWVSASLQRKFGSVTLYPNKEALVAADPDMIVIIDARSQLITPRSSNVESTVAAYFYDKSFNCLGIVEGHESNELTPLWFGNKRSDEIVADIVEQQDVQIKALQKFDQSLNGFLARQSDAVSSF